MTIAILCGGSGTRLWPLSRSFLPKQFAPLLKNGSFFTQTLIRNTPLIKTHKARFQIIANDAHYFLAQDQAKKAEVEIDSYILESLGKNTAPALCFSALETMEKYGENEIILALPSDHLVKNTQKYQQAVNIALEYADKNYVTTFGITPNCPHTGYGYIKRKDNDDVEKFIEKPNLITAESYIQEGGYFWNSGMFCFKVRIFLEELQKYSIKVYETCKIVYENAQKNQFIRLDPLLSENLPDISIDYALMEKSQKVKCVIGDFDWNDVGSFEALDQEWEKDDQGNAGKNKIIAKNSKNNFILSEKIVAAIGVQDLIVVDTNDSLLIVQKGQSAQIKDIVATLKLTHPELTQIHTTAYRPWGSYSVLLENKGYKIKQIVVNPESRLSLQKHFHRNEHWIVASGCAVVTIGEKKIFLKANESTYIPMGELHRLENLGKIELVVIEVQMGDYLGEDDIVRIEDDFKRH